MKHILTKIAEAQALIQSADREADGTDRVIPTDVESSEQELDDCFKIVRDRQSFYTPTSISRSEFINILKDSEYGHYYTDEGMNAIYDYYVKRSRDTGEDIETDVDEIAVDWEEFSEEEFISQFSDRNHSTLDEVVKYMEEWTTLIPLPSGRWLVLAY
jgi:hypothetical protein